MAAIAVGAAVVQYALTPKPKIQPVDRGRVDDVRLQTSELNGSRPRVFGKARLAGNIFWSTEVQEHISTTPGQSSGKGGGGGGTSSQPERHYSYTTNLAIAFCEGPISNGITKVWDGPDLIINREGAHSFYSFYEAEASENTLVGATRVNNTEASGGRAVLLDAAGESVKFNRITQQTADGTLSIVYSSGTGLTVNVYVNDVLLQALALTATGGAELYEAIQIPIELTALTNTVKLAWAGTSGQSAQIDAIQVSDNYIGPIIPPQEPGPHDPPEPGLPPREPWQPYRTGLIDEGASFPADQNNPLPFYNHYTGPDADGVMTGVSASGARGQFNFYNGTATQPQDPLMVQFDGAEATPAYRHLCFMSVGDYELPGGQMRQWTVEVDEGTTDLAQIMIKLYGLAKHPEEKLDVSALEGIYVPGLVISQRIQLQEIIQALADFFAFDVIDLDGKIVAVPRGAASYVTIPAHKITPYKYGSQSPAGSIKITRRDVMDLPESVNVGFLDQTLDYHQNSEPVTRQEGDSRDPASLNFPIVADAETAHQVGLRWLFSRHLEREALEFALGIEYAYLAPAAVVTLQDVDATHTVRITSMQTDMFGLIRCKAVPEKASLYNQNQLGRMGTGIERPRVELPANTELFIFDTPAMRSEDRGVGYWLAACGRGNGTWRGCVVYQRQLSGTDYYELTTITQPATMGLTNTVLAADPGGSFDSTSSVRVYLYSGALVSHTESELDANPNLNLLYVGGELTQFTTATPVANPPFPYTAAYDVSGFLRTRFASDGTEKPIGSKVVLMNGALKRRNAEVEEIGLTRKFKGVSIGGLAVSNAPEVSYAIEANAPPPVTDLVLEQKWSSDAMYSRIANIFTTFRFNYFPPDTQRQYAQVFVTRSGASESLVGSVYPAYDPVGGFFYGQLYIPAPVMGDYTVRVLTYSDTGRTLDESVTEEITIAANGDYSDPTWAAQLLPGIPQFTWNGSTIEGVWTKALATNVRYQVARDSLFTQLVYEGTNNRCSFAALATGTQTYYLRSVDAQGKFSATVSNAVTVTAASQPGVITPSEDGESITLSIPATTGAAFFLITDDDTSQSTLVDAVQGGATTYKAPITSGRTVYHYSVNALNGGLFASTTRTVTYTVPDPATPVSYVIAFVDGMYVNHRLTVSGNYQYQYATANDGTGILTTAKGAFDELLGSFSSRTITRYARTIHKSGKTSAWVPQTITIAAPGAPTVTKDAVRQNEVFVVLHVSPPAAPGRVKYTVIQTRAVGGSFPATTASNTDHQIRYPGVKEEIVLDFTAGQSIEYRVCYEDAFTSTLNDRNWSTTGSHTFARFQDIAIDPTSALSKLAAEAGPIMTGGGTINVSSGGVVSWSAAFTVGPLPAGFSPTGQMTINADSRTPNINQIVIARHTKGSSAAASIVVTDMSSYTPPAHDATTYDRWIVWRRPDGKWKFYNGLVLDANQSFGADTFIPYLSTLEAIIGVAKISKANILSVYAQSIVAADGTFNHITMGGPLESASFVSHGSTTPQTEAGLWDSTTLVGGTLNTLTQSITKTVAGTAWGTCYAWLSRQVFYGDCELSTIYDGTGGVGSYRGFGFTIKFSGTLGDVGVSGDFEHSIVFSGAGDFWTSTAGAQTQRAGTSFGPGALVTGDKLVINLTGSTVTFSIIRNGAVFGSWTQTATAKRGLAVAGSVYASGASLGQLTVNGVLAPFSGSKIHPQYIVNVALDANDDFTKSGGTDGVWGDSGFSSYESIPASYSGGITFKAGQTNKWAVVGLSTTDADQNYTSIQRGWVVGGDGHAYVSESGAPGIDKGTYTTSTVFYVGREGADWVYRLNGVEQRRVAGASTSALYADTSFNSSGVLLKSLRMIAGGAMGQGWQLDNQKAGQINTGFSIMGNLIDRWKAGAIDAVTTLGVYRGRDRAAVMLHKYTSGKVSFWQYVGGDSDAVKVEISLRYPGIASDDGFGNTDSARFAQVKALNQFGDELATFEPVSFNGDGICGIGSHSARYAHPEFQAIYAVRIYNQAGWTEKEKFIQGNVVYDTMPTLARRIDVPLELTVNALSMPPVAGTSAAVSHSGGILFIQSGEEAGTTPASTVHYRRVGETAWRDITPGTMTIPLEYHFITSSCKLSSGDEYEFRLKDTAKSFYSNVVRFRTPPPTPSPDLSVDNCVAKVASATGNPTVITYIYTSTARTVTVYFYREEEGSVATLISTQAIAAGAGRTLVFFADATAVRGTRYRYWVAGSVLDGAITRYTQPTRSIIVSVPPSSNAADPTNLRDTAQFITELQFAVNLNSAVGTVTFEFKAVGTGDPNTSAFWSSGVSSTTLAAGTSSFTKANVSALGGLSQGTKYAARVKVSDAGTVYSNVRVAQTAYDTTGLAF
jgi:hypothetical protein